MTPKLAERLNQILPRIRSESFLKGHGLGNEIGFFVFDYPPEEELAVREHLNVITGQLKLQCPTLRFAVVDLFRLLIDHMKERKLLGPSCELQVKKGDEELKKALKAPLREDRLAEVFIKEANPKENDIIFINGVGNSWPLLRTHTLLNNLQSRMGQTPLVVFYPGVYDGQGFRLFGRLTEDNYYRAFRLIS